MIRLVFRALYPNLTIAFARQNRYELHQVSSGFTLFCIVHHLSGPNMHALPDLLTEGRLPGIRVPPDRASHFYFHYATGFFQPEHSRQLDPWVRCFKTVSFKAITPAS